MPAVITDVEMLLIVAGVGMAVNIVSLIMMQGACVCVPSAVG